ncbi:MAG: hypothetical protein ACD_33C00002G0006 [uncultured bacterium]|nr:MAG: hypothetical protein ACD_33C00002G0006 [uncultured bacterium]
MILKTPYEFSLLKLQNISTITSNITKYIITDYAYIKTKEQKKIKPFVNDDTVLNPVFLYGLSDVEKDIPPFAHPIFNFQDKWVAMDLRNIVTPNKENVTYVIRNEAEYDLTLQRFILSGMWATGKQSSLYSLKFAHIAFTNWLSDNLTKRFGLNLNDNIKLKVLALLYYANLFNNEFNADDLNKLIIRSKEEMLGELIEEVYSKVGNKIGTLEEFCSACYIVTDNVRLKGLDVNVLVNILSNNWMSLNSKDLVMLSLEHPPTWISLVYASLVQRNFKKNYIATLIDKLNKRGKGDEFLKSYIYTVKEYLEE